MFVAVGAALFKPVVVGTVAKVTDDSNSATGFGIFYMMVNIGGFVGPIVAGVVRGWGWEYVFIACSVWAVVNLLIVLTALPRARDRRRASARARSSKVLDNMVEVLGNVRFFLTVFVRAVRADVRQPAASASSPTSPGPHCRDLHPGLARR